MDKFILEVKALPILWDVNHMFYRDSWRKRETWDIVAEKCGVTNGEEAKLLWSKLRSSHREAMRRRSEGKNLREWKYEKLLEFLLTRNTETANAINTDDNSKVKFNVEVIKEDVTDEESQSMDGDPDMSKKIDHSHIDSVEKFNNNRKRPLDVENYERDVENMTEMWEEKVKQPTKTLSPKNGRRNDGLSEFFLCLYEKTRNLPKHLQIRVEREVFGSITRAEEEAYNSSIAAEVERKRNKVKITTKEKGVVPSPKIRYVQEYNEFTEELCDDAANTCPENSQPFNDPIESIIVKVDPDEDIETVGTTSYHNAL